MNTELDWLKGRYVEELDMLYGGEMALLKRLPQMVEVAHAPALKSALQYHFEKTRAQVGRLNQIFAGLGCWPVTYAQHPLRAPGKGTRSTLPGTYASAESDDRLISTARAIEQGEISGYLLALNFAEILHDRSAVDLLEMTLTEEYEADQILAELGQSESVVSSVPSGSR